MKTDLLSDAHLREYETWYKEHPFIFQSEVEALRQMLPAGENLRGIEVGVGTGRFANALNIKEGVEPSETLRELALKRGIEVMNGTAEHLPYGDLSFDFVLSAFCINCFNDLHVVFREAGRVLRKNGVLIVGFINRHSIIGKYYEEHKPESSFYRHANFFAVEKVVFELNLAGFRHFKFCQTLFNSFDKITSPEQPKPGYGEGSFIVIQARKR